MLKVHQPFSQQKTIYVSTAKNIQGNFMLKVTQPFSRQKTIYVSTTKRFKVILYRSYRNNFHNRRPYM